MAQITINTGTSANDRTGTNWRTAWQAVQSMFTEVYGKLFETGKVLSDNNYNNTEKAAVSFVKDNPIAYVAAIPFTKALTDIATHTMVANITLTVNSTDAVDNACSQLLLINNVLYTSDVTSFHLVGEHDNTFAYSLLTFERKRGLYIVSITNFD